MSLGAKRHILTQGLLRILLLIVFALATAHAADSNTATKKLEKLRAQITRLDREKRGEIKRKKRTLAELEPIEKRIATLSLTLASLSARETKLATRERLLQRRDVAAAADAKTANIELMQLLRAAFLLGAEPRLKLALEGKNPATSARLLGYYGYYVQARTRRIKELTRRISGYRRDTRRLAITRIQLATTITKQRHMLSDLEQARIQRKHLVARLNRKISGKKYRIASLQRDAARLERLVNSVRRNFVNIRGAQAAKTDFARLRGRLPWPVSGRIIARFGTPRAGGELSWQAVRIAARAGSRVHAIAYGRIAYAGWLPYYGLVLIVDHGQGYLTVYGHNQALYRQVGDWVQPGAVIATVGSSGGQAEPALYFQIRHNDHPLNPQRWCVRRNRLETSPRPSARVH